MRVESVPEVRITQDVRLPTREIHVVSLGCSAQRACAMAISARCAYRGAAGKIWPEGSAFHAVGAVFFDEESAKGQTEALLHAENIAAQTIVLVSQGPDLRITASQRQIDAFLAAEDALFCAAQALSQIAQRIDAGQVDLSGARSALLAQKALLGDAREPLLRLAGKSETDACGALAGLLFCAQDDIGALCGRQSDTRLQYSSSVRALQTDILYALFAWREGLRAQ